MKDGSQNSFLPVAVVLAFGMIGAGFVVGHQVKQIGGARQVISVKGLAEKNVQADMAEWTVTTEVTGSTFADALAKLRATQPRVRAFLAAQGFQSDSTTDSAESVGAHMVESEDKQGRTRYEQKGFDANQSLTVKTKNLSQVVAANKAILQLEAEGIPVRHHAPLFMLSNLEEIKMSLIGSATQNAFVRANEFAKNGNAKVGPMRSASQGAFYILPAGASADVDAYGGAYDKTTIDKLARVVVTIE